MSNFTVRRRGTDTSGRGIYATDHMWDWWERVLDELGFTPVIVQGAFMLRNGGGAVESAGYHDQGGCLDLRTWNLDDDQQERLVRTIRRHGAAAWRRDQRHGMDPHLHLVLGTDKPLAPGAARQWLDYIDGRNGLDGGGPDYEWRPSPLVLTPPEDEMNEADWQRMEKLLDTRIEAALNKPLVDVGKSHKWSPVRVLGAVFKGEGKAGR